MGSFSSKKSACKTEACDNCSCSKAEVPEKDVEEKKTVGTKKKSKGKVRVSNRRPD